MQAAIAYRARNLRPAIPGRAPVVISFTSGNFGANARCHQLYVRQSRGKHPLSSAARPAIPGQPPVVVDFPFGNFGAHARCRQTRIRQFWGERPLSLVSHPATPGHGPVAVDPVANLYRFTLIRQPSGTDPTPFLFFYSIIVHRRMISWLFVF